MAEFEIEALLQKVMGLKVSSIGKSTLDRSVQRRMKSLSISDKDVYVKHLNTSALEIKELIEEVVIPETWFFRDREPFKSMTQFFSTQWAPKHTGKKLFRVLSSPCSTGEEPYSLTMTLLDCGLPSDKFSIHGVDISHRSIASAKAGVYTGNSFRGTDLTYQSKYFNKINKSYILKENIREKVHFHTGNVLNRPFMEGLGLFDVIFFRNVLIYFDAISRHQAITTLYKILADDGILFVGHAEANLFNNSPFTPAPYTQSFAFHKKTKQDATIATKETISPKIPINKRIYPFHRKPPKDQPDLNVARQLADKGEFQKATKICEEYLDQCGSSAQAFFLLGVIQNAADDVDQAAKFFRKALYLDPNHEEAMIFLALLSEKTGNIAEAKTLKQRIERLKPNTA